MPVYEYKCTKCGKTFEKLQTFKEGQEPQICECGEPAKKLISQSTFVLKGDGWTEKFYTTSGRKGS